MSTSTSSSTLLIGDTEENDDILIKFVTVGSTQMTVDDSLITISAGELSISSSTTVTLQSDSQIQYSHSGSTTGLANGNIIKIGSSSVTAINLLSKHKFNLSLLLTQVLIVKICL